MAINTTRNLPEFKECFFSRIGRGCSPDRKGPDCSGRGVGSNRRTRRKLTAAFFTEST